MMVMMKRRMYAKVSVGVLKEGKGEGEKNVELENGTCRLGSV